MLEFVLFHEQPLKLFVQFLEEQKVPVETSSSPVTESMFEIRIPEDLDEQLLVKIEQRYDELMDMNQELFYAENAPAQDNYRMASLILTLQNGDQSQAHVDPDLLGRILEVISHDELNQFIDSIVKAVEDPDARTFCQKVRAGDVAFDGDEKGD